MKIIDQNKLFSQQQQEEDRKNKENKNKTSLSNPVEVIKKNSNQKIVILPPSQNIENQKPVKTEYKNIEIQQENELQKNITSKIKVDNNDEKNFQFSFSKEKTKKILTNDIIKFIKRSFLEEIEKQENQKIKNVATSKISNYIIQLLNNKQQYLFKEDLTTEDLHQQTRKLTKKIKNLNKNTKNRILLEKTNKIIKELLKDETEKNDVKKLQILEFLEKEKQKILSLLNKITSSEHNDQEINLKKERKIFKKKNKFSVKSVLTKEIEEKEEYFAKRSVSSYFIYSEYVPVYENNVQKENSHQIKKLAKVVYEHNPEYIGTLYRVRFGLIPSNQIYNLASPEHVVPVEHDEKRKENKKKIAEEYIKKFNETVGFYEKLEQSILSEGIRNPIIVVSGEPRVVSSDLIDKEYIEKTPYEKRLYCEQLGGSRLYIFQKYGWHVPCIICDWTGGFSEYMELKTPEEINQFFIDKTQIYFTHKGLKVLPPLHVHLDEENRSPELMSKIRKEFFNERKNK